MRWRQDRETGKLIEVKKVRAANSGPAVHRDIEPFVSHVDGSYISSNSQLREHNKKHGVSNDLDSLREQTQREMQRTPYTGSREERITDIKESIAKLQ